ncbi:MAG: hypothetical protein R2727_12250 [Bacteroidales bacterium]
MTIIHITNVGNFVNNGADHNGVLILGGEGGVQFRYGFGTGNGIVSASLNTEGHLALVRWYRKANGLMEELHGVTRSLSSR